MSKLKSTSYDIPADAEVICGSGAIFPFDLVDNRVLVATVKSIGKIVYQDGKEGRKMQVESDDKTLFTVLETTGLTEFFSLAEVGGRYQIVLEDILPAKRGRQPFKLFSVYKLKPLS